MNTMNRFLGVALIVISAAAFSTLAILGRYAYAEGMNTSTILFLRFSLSTGLLLVLLALRGESLPRGLTLAQLIGMGAIGYVGQSFSFLSALKYASPGLVDLLLYLYPIFVAILSAIWLHERITPLKALALGLALAGVALTVGPEGGQWPGIVLAISAAVIYSVYIMVGTEVVKQVSAIQSSTVIFGSAGAMSGLLMMESGPHFPGTETGWIVIGLIVVIATVLPVATFLAGLARVGATNAAMLSTLEPVITVLLAAALLGETLEPVALLGGGIILAAVLLLLSQSTPLRATPALAGEGPG
ncbi:MAG: DMT family transporter [Chloroflexi bacterium]|nr:DMT family transporter [Chloroflexota bacterium]